MMDQAKRAGLERLRESLLLAAEDMPQAVLPRLSARTPARTTPGGRALETAMAVAYMRPFTRGAWKLPDKFARWLRGS